DVRLVDSHGNRAAVFERLGDDLVEAEPLVLRAGPVKVAQALDLIGPSLELARGCLHEYALEILRRVDGGIADHEGDARGIRSIVLRHDIAIAGDDANARESKAEHLGDGLHEDGGRPLPDVRGAR